MPIASRARIIASTALFAATLLGPADAFAQQAALSPADLLTAPFVPELSAAPAGGRVAWVANQEGRRNISCEAAQTSTPPASGSGADRMAGI